MSYSREKIFIKMKIFGLIQNKFFFSVFFALLVNIAYTQPFQNHQWSLAPTNFDFDAGNPLVQPFPITTSGNYSGANAMNCHNSMQDENGDLLFFVVDNNVYDYAGYYLGSTTAKGYSEIALVPVPGNCDQYYIISCSGSDPQYYILDMSLPSIYNPGHFGELISNFTIDHSISHLIPGYFTGEPKQRTGYIAVSPIRPDNSRFLFLSNGYSVFRCIIDVTGIHYDNDFFDFDFAQFNQQRIRGEMEVVQLSSGNYRLACSYEYEFVTLPTIKAGAAIYTCELDVNGVLVSGSSKSLIIAANGNDIVFPSIHGLEFSPSGDILYVTHEPVINHPASIEYYDFNNPTVSVQPFLAPNAVDFKNSQIELGPNNNLYFVNSTKVATISSPNNPSIANWVDNAFSISYYLNDADIATIPLSITEINSFILPDQIDGEDYYSKLNCGSCSIDLGLDQTVCASSSVMVDIGNNWTDIKWYKNNALIGNTSSQLNITTSGKYCVIAKNATGCMAQDCIDIIFKNATTSTITYNKAFSTAWNASSPNESNDYCLTAFEDPATGKVFFSSYSNYYQASLSANIHNIQSDQLSPSGCLVTGIENVNLNGTNLVVNYNNLYSNGATKGVLMTGHQGQILVDEEFLIRIDDAAGNPIYSQTFPDAVNGRSIIQDSNGDIVAVGETNTNIFVVKMDVNHNILFINEYEIGSEQSSKAFSVVEANGLVDNMGVPFPNAQYLITGEVSGDVFVLAIDENSGNISYGGALVFNISDDFQDVGESIIFDTQGNIIVAGTHNYNIPFLMKFNTLGVPLPSINPLVLKLHIDNVPGAVCRSVVEDQNGDYIMAGFSSGSFGSDAKGFLAKISPDLQTLGWVNSYLSPAYDACYVSRVFSTGDNGFLMSSTCLMNSLPNIDINIIKTDNNGFINDCDCFDFSSGTIESEIVYNWGPVSTVRNTQFPPIRSLTYPLNSELLLNQMVCSGVNCTTPVSTSSTDGFEYVKNHTIYPNPVADELSYKFYSNNRENATIYIVDLLGRELMKKNIQTMIGDNLNTIEVANLSAGFYCIKIQMNSRFYTIGKFVKIMKND